MTNYIGKAVKRVEDKRFLTGKGRYTDDIVLPGMLYAYIVRSPYAHAKINNIDTSRAEKMDGVVKIYTGKDIAESGINGIPTGWQVNFKNGDTMKEPPHPLLVADKARYMGDGVVVVIAESREEARDAADEIDVDWEELPAVANAKKATEDGAPLVHDEAPNNKCFDWELGNPKEEVDKA
ncbi:MAG: xanthine dehydrogenase family protein molybdopterin-binding subunit, partial [Planctomycetota bacterium]